MDGRAATSRGGRQRAGGHARGRASSTARPFTVVVDYARQAAGRSSNEALGDGGWLRTEDGAFALGQPESASTWFPVNDHPSDKATFTLAMTVPDGVEALSNGVPGERTSADGWTTWTWTESAPMASYLATVVIGQYRVTSRHPRRQADGHRDPGVAARGRAAPRSRSPAPARSPTSWRPSSGRTRSTRTAASCSTTTGSATPWRRRPARCTATRSSAAARTSTVVAHELAHQWFGDSVALERWQDIWLNEGFATYAEWLWQEHEGERHRAASFDRRLRGLRLDRCRPATRARSSCSATAVYQRGAMTVHALRRDDRRRGVLRAAQDVDRPSSRDGNVTHRGVHRRGREGRPARTSTTLFDAWLFGTAQPPKP